MKQFNCARCYKEFEAKPRTYRNSINRYCSRSCSLNGPRERHPKNKMYSSKDEFGIDLLATYKPKEKNMNLNRYGLHTCERCSVPFKGKSISRKRVIKHRYCSRACYAPITEANIQIPREVEFGVDLLATWRVR